MGEKCVGRTAVPWKGPAVATYSDFASWLGAGMGNNACLQVVLFPLADGAPHVDTSGV